jgi:phytanoyl-CoA hydroxylase
MERNPAMDKLSDAQWSSYQKNGYLRLGIIDQETLHTLQTRIDNIMLGTADVHYDRMLMQIDSQDGKHAGPQTKGHKGSTLNYRKIQDLEWDPVFLEYMQRPLWKDVCGRAYGKGTSIACNRAMFMNKPSHRGTFLSWHQDRWPRLDRDPEVTIYTSLDPATIENGCLRILLGSHRTLLNPESKAGYLGPELEKTLTEETMEYLELEAGEVVLLHNWLAHSSGINESSQSRRAFSVCYQDASTIDETNETYPIIFGKDTLTPTR